MDNYNYPVGSDTKEAPWNEVEQSSEEIEVTVSITLSKTLKIKVKDYEIISEGVDEDGNPYRSVSFKDCNLKDAVLNQICLPQNAYKYILAHTPVYYNLKDWNVDDFEVILE